MLFAKAEFNGFEELDEITSSKKWKSLCLWLREKEIGFDWFIDNSQKPTDKIEIVVVTFGFFVTPPFFIRRYGVDCEEIVKRFRQAGIKLEKFVEK